MEKRECLYCKKEYEPIKENQKFCSVSCNSKYYGERNKKNRVCKRCGKDFWSPEASKKRSRYCPECAEKNKEEAERKRIENNTKPIYYKQCPICGEYFETTRKTKLLCDKDECKKKYECNKSRNYAIAKHKIQEHVCKYCGKHFFTDYGDKHKCYCCNEHKEQSYKEHKEKEMKNAYNRKRSKQMKEAFVERVYIKKLYKRDKGICGICGKPIKFDTDPKSKWALTRDHIIPLSKGGEHSMKNCQIAHRICNSYKLDSLNFHIDWDELEKIPENERYKYLCDNNPQ